MLNVGDPSRTPTQSGGWPAFWLCLLLHMLFPLLPLGFELLLTGQITDTAAVLVASTYTITIAITSKGRYSQVFTVVGFFCCVVFAAIYGSIASASPTSASYGVFFWAAVITIVAFFVVHAGERYNRHVENNEPYDVFQASE